MTDNEKLLVQCDFDGTVTLEDVGFHIMDAFAGFDWKTRYEDYIVRGIISVGQFNREGFGAVKVGPDKVREVIRREAVMRPGFKELLDFCEQNGIRFTIVSNGLDFYIEETLKKYDIEGVEIHAARTDFTMIGMAPQYYSPSGIPIDREFKVSWVDFFLAEGYRVLYIGDGTSDLSAARKCEHIFATDSLLEACREEELPHTPFSDLNDVVRMLENLE